MQSSHLRMLRLWQIIWFEQNRFYSTHAHSFWLQTIRMQRMFEEIHHNVQFEGAQENPLAITSFGSVPFVVGAS